MGSQKLPHEPWRRVATAAHVEDTGFSEPPRKRRRIDGGDDVVLSDEAIEDLAKRFARLLSPSIRPTRKEPLAAALEKLVLGPQPLEGYFQGTKIPDVLLKTAPPSTVSKPCPWKVADGPCIYELRITGGTIWLSGSEISQECRFSPQGRGYQLLWKTAGADGQVYERTITAMDRIQQHFWENDSDLGQDDEEDEDDVLTKILKIDIAADMRRTLGEGYDPASLSSSDLRFSVPQVPRF